MEENRQRLIIPSSWQKGFVLFVVVAAVAAVLGGNLEELGQFSKVCIIGEVSDTVFQDVGEHEAKALMEEEIVVLHFVIAVIHEWFQVFIDDVEKFKEVIELRLEAVEVQFFFLVVIHEIHAYLAEVLRESAQAVWWSYFTVFHGVHQAVQVTENGFAEEVVRK